MIVELVRYDENNPQPLSRFEIGYGGDPADAQAQAKAIIEILTEHSRPHPWNTYVAENAAATVVGMCAFKNIPDDDGTVEIAYGTLPVFARSGVAKAMAAALVDIARRNGAALVLAHTAREHNPSTRVLRANDFEFVGEVVDPEDGELWRWQKAV